MRIYAKGKYICKIIKWFETMQNREFSADREFLEELIHTDILPYDAVNILIDKCKTDVQHYVEAFLVSDGICVGRSEPFEINIVRGAIVHNSK